MSKFAETKLKTLALISSINCTANISRRKKNILISHVWELVATALGESINATNKNK